MSYRKRKRRRVPNKKGHQRHREHIWARDKGRCQRCGCHCNRRPGSPAQGTLDHIVPRSRGGSHDPHNLQLLCSRCNTRKADQDPRDKIDLTEAGMRAMPPDILREFILLHDFR